MEDKKFLIWLHQRLVRVFNEDPYSDFMWKLRGIIAATPADQLTLNTTQLQPNDPIFTKAY